MATQQEVARTEQVVAVREESGAALKFDEMAADSPADESSAASTTTETTSNGAPSNSKPSSYKHIPHSQKPPHLVAKRNARERRRVQAVNQAFYKLRKSVPIENRNKRVSKVKTLQRAIDYIRKLERVLAAPPAACEPEASELQFSTTSGAGPKRGTKSSVTNGNGACDQLQDKKSTVRANSRQAAGERTKQAQAEEGTVVRSQRRGRKPKAATAAEADAQTTTTTTAARDLRASYLNNSRQDHLALASENNNYQAAVAVEPVVSYGRLHESHSEQLLQATNYYGAPLHNISGGYNPLVDSTAAAVAGAEPEVRRETRPGEYGTPISSSSSSSNHHHPQPHPPAQEICSSSSGPSVAAPSAATSSAPTTATNQYATAVASYDTAYHYQLPLIINHRESPAYEAAVDSPQQQQQHRYAAAWSAPHYQQQQQQPAPVEQVNKRQVLAMEAASGATNKDIERDNKSDTCAGPRYLAACGTGTGTSTSTSRRGNARAVGQQPQQLFSQLMPADSTSAATVAVAVESPASLARSSPCSPLRSLDLSGTSTSSSAASSAATSKSTTSDDKSSPITTAAYAPAEATGPPQQVNNYLGHSYHLSFQQQQQQQTPGGQSVPANNNNNEQACKQQQQNGSRSSARMGPQVVRAPGDYLANNNLHGNNGEATAHHYQQQQQHHDGQLFHSAAYYHGHHHQHHHQHQYHDHQQEQQHNYHYQQQSQFQQQHQQQRQHFAGNQMRLQQQHGGGGGSSGAHLSDRGAHHLQHALLNNEPNERLHASGLSANTAQHYTILPL